MPNLVGVRRRGAGRSAIDAVVDRQLRAVETRATVYTEHRFCTDDFGAALQDHGLLGNGPQPAASADGRYHLWLDGEVLNGSELAQRYRHVLGPEVRSAPALCLALIVRYGPEVARELNGLFAIALHDARDGRVTLIADRYAFRPLFYRAAGETFAFGTELKAVRAADESPVQLDETAIVELLCFGSHVHGSTWYSGCSRLTPAMILEHDQNGTRTRTYWTYRYDESARRLDEASYVARFAVLLDRAVERCMRGAARIGMFLSGGYDSRSVAASIRPQHLPIPSFTFGVGAKPPPPMGAPGGGGPPAPAAPPAAARRAPRPESHAPRR
jgi:asparagine synthase (glutamine-hydrolysing)